eukprot:gene16640-34641_t
MNFEYFCLTDPGLVRDNNEDSVSLDAENQIAVLADGMGGYNAGEVASAMATTFIKTELGRWMAEGGVDASVRELRRAMEICIDNANRSIFNAANSNPQYAGMGTTLVMGVFLEARVMIGHVGDSRCYLLREGQTLLLTHDHTVNHPDMRHQLLRAVGLEDHLVVDYLATSCCAPWAWKTT